MTDIVNKAKRSAMMSGIRSKNTQPECLIRKHLFARGYRYRLHAKALAGKPDLTFPKYKAVLFVHGCFWHGHPCHLFKWPQTREVFWREKISSNQRRDETTRSRLEIDGWRIGVVWECALKGKTKIELTDLIDRIDTWLQSDVNYFEIPQ